MGSSSEDSFISTNDGGGQEDYRERQQQKNDAQKVDGAPTASAAQQAALPKFIGEFLIQQIIFWLKTGTGQDFRGFPMHFFKFWDFSFDFARLTFFDCIKTTDNNF